MYSIKVTYIYIYIYIYIASILYISSFIVYEDVLSA